MNEFTRAGVAFIYVALVATFIGTVPERFFPVVHPSVGITLMLSLLVVSVAVMAYLFFWQPSQLLIAGDAKGALLSFVRTLSYFVGLVLLLAAVLIALGGFSEVREVRSTYSDPARHQA